MVEKCWLRGDGCFLLIPAPPSPVGPPLPLHLLLCWWRWQGEGQCWRKASFPNTWHQERCRAEERNPSESVNPYHKKQKIPPPEWVPALWRWATRAKAGTAPAAEGPNAGATAALTSGLKGWPVPGRRSREDKGGPRVSEVGAGDQPQPLPLKLSVNVCWGVAFGHLSLYQSLGPGYRQVIKPLILLNLAKHVHEGMALQRVNDTHTSHNRMSQERSSSTPRCAHTRTGETHLTHTH